MFLKYKKHKSKDCTNKYLVIVQRMQLWSHIIDNIAKFCNLIVNAVLGSTGPHISVIIYLRLANNKYLKVLNRKFRGLHKSTNMLTFPMLCTRLTDQEQSNFGHIVISFNKMNIESYEKYTNFYQHFCYSFAHGFLHLLRFNHKKYVDKNIMQKVETLAIFINGNIFF